MIIPFAIGVIFIMILLSTSFKEEKKYNVNDKGIDETLHRHYLKLLGLEHHRMISPDTITDAYLDKVRLLLDNGGIHGELEYLNELKAARNYLLDACEYLANRN